jgi:hypothetical protein
MHWSHTEAGQWRCAVADITYHAYRVSDRRWIAEKIDPAGHYTTLGSYDTFKNCNLHVEHRSLPLCFDFLPDGALVLASGPRQALLRVDLDGNLRTYTICRRWGHSPATTS